MVNLIDPVLDPNQLDFGKAHEFLTVADMMRWLRVSRSTLKVWVKRGELPEPVRIGKGLRWEVGPLQTWIELKKAGTWLAVPPASSTAPSVAVAAVSENEGDWPA